MNKKIYYLIGIIIVALLAYFVFSGNSTKANTRIMLETNYGNITLEMFDSSMPLTTANFEKLVTRGFYNNLTFHRVIPDFMIQGGDPLGNNMGGPGYTIKDEFSSSNKNDRGTLAMANGGPNTGGSQFFINTVNNNYLDSKHPVFGRVIDGMNLVDEISQVPRDGDDKPLIPVVITKARIISY